MKKIFSVLTIVICVVAFTNSAEAAVNYYTDGHAHIGVVEDGSLGLHFHAPDATINGVENSELECEAGEVITVVPSIAATPRPEGSNWDLIGNSASDTTWVLPQSHQTGIPYIGFGAHDALGIYVDNDITISLVAFSGTGQFSLYSTDAFGNPEFYMSTYDAGSDTYVFDLDGGDHAHLNFAFTEVGTYELTFQATAELVSGGTETSTATFTFEVVPEPVTLALLGFGGLFLRRKA